MENKWGLRAGVGEICLEVIRANSKAIRRPVRVTAMAAIFDEKDMVKMGVLSIVMLEVIKSPVIILPQASRLIGLITEGLFSLIGDNGRNRGWPIDTKNTIRRL